jgi:AraC family transcriptional regulator, transcriptional activator FtrA
MDPDRQVRNVACVVYDQLSLFEAGIASEVFGIERPEFEQPLYRFRVAQAEPGSLRSHGGLRLRADGGLRLLCGADLIIIPGWRDHRKAPPAALLRALRRAHGRGAQLLSICTGAFALAAAGLLDGRAATTHWRYATAFRERFPLVDLQPDVLYVDAGSIITSAGSAAGIDACLHVVRRHHGAAVANRIARTMVTPPHRQAGQAQFVPAPLGPAAGGGIGPVLEWARARLSKPVRVADMAQRAAMSERNFLRRFSAQVGMGPKQWLRRERVAAAQVLLEQSVQGMESVAQAVGFGSASALRTAFRQTIGAPPTLHRRQFGGLLGR